MVCKTWAALVPPEKLDSLKREWWGRFWWKCPGDKSDEVSGDYVFYSHKQGTAYAVGTRWRPYCHTGPFGPGGGNSVRACKLIARSGLVLVYMCSWWWYARGPEYAVVCNSGVRRDDGRRTIYFKVYRVSDGGVEYCDYHDADYLAPTLRYPMGTGYDGMPFTVKLPAEMIPRGDQFDSILAGMLQMCHNALREVAQVAEAQERESVQNRDRGKKKEKKKKQRKGWWRRTRKMARPWGKSIATTSRRGK
jgi:hypothetical protein